MISDGILLIRYRRLSICYIIDGKIILSIFKIERMGGVADD